MKKIIIFISLISSSIFFSQVIITTETNPIPKPNVVLEVKSTQKGLLVPRMTTVQRLAIDSPIQGLLVYDTDKKEIFIFSASNFSNIAENWKAITEPKTIEETILSNL